jgi:hypothetical protein
MGLRHGLGRRVHPLDTHDLEPRRQVLHVALLMQQPAFAEHVELGVPALRLRQCAIGDGPVEGGQMPAIEVAH